MPKFATLDEFRSFMETASTEEIRAVNRELGRKLVKKMLLGMAIGLAIGGALVLAGKAIAKNQSEDDVDNVIYDTTPDI